MEPDFSLAILGIASAVLGITSMALTFVIVRMSRKLAVKTAKKNIEIEVFVNSEKAEKKLTELKGKLQEVIDLQGKAGG